MIQTPFPELKTFETPPRLPSLEHLLASLPKPSYPAKKETAPTSLPTFPLETPKSRALATKQAQTIKKPIPTTKLASTSIDPENPQPSNQRTAQTPPMPSPFTLAVTQAMLDEETEPEQPPATDADFQNAINPLIEHSLEHVLYSPNKGLHTYLEPMLRSTVRRAIAEQIDTAVQFRSTGTVDRVGWRLKALMTSRSYDDVVFQSTRRYQVEEAILLRIEDFSLVSFASHDPARHASEKRIAPTVKKLIPRITDSEGRLRKTFEVGDNRVGIIREGKHTILLATVRGRSNALVRADLDYVLRQVEERFAERLEEETSAFLHVLQPILEGCLLIQSPSAPN